MSKKKLSVPPPDRGRRYKVDDTDAIASVLSSRLKDFLEKPAEVILKELPPLIGYVDELEYENLKAKCDAVGQIFERLEFVEGRPGASGTRAIIDQWTYHYIRHSVGSAFRLLLYQLFIEGLLTSYGDFFGVRNKIRSEWGVNELSAPRLAGEILRMFDGGIKARLEARQPGNPQAETGKQPKVSKRRKVSLHDIACEVRKLFRPDNPTKVTAKAVAASLGVSDKTIERRVAENGQSWQKFVVEVTDRQG